MTRMDLSASAKLDTSSAAQPVEDLVAHGLSSLCGGTVLTRRAGARPAPGRRRRCRRASSPAGRWRTTTGPSRPPTRKPGAERQHGRPVHRAEGEEGQGGDAVGDPHDDVLRGVAAGQRLRRRGEQQREHEHARAGAEVAAVDGDEEHAPRQQPGVADRLPPGQGGGRRAQQHGDRAGRDQPGDEPGEGVGRGEQQQCRRRAPRRRRWPRRAGAAARPGRAAPAATRPPTRRCSRRSATVLVTLADTGGSPAASSAG